MDRQLLCAIHRITFLTLQEKELLADILSGREAFLALTLERLYRMIGRRGKTSSFDPQDLWRKAERDCSVCEHLGISVVAFRDLLYPPQLREIFDPPFILFVRGTLPTAEKPMIAVVGTRRPTGKAVKHATDWGSNAPPFQFPLCPVWPGA